MLPSSVSPSAVSRWAAFALLLLAPALHAQEPARQGVTLRGQVVDRSSGRPVASAVVRIESLGRTAVTDAEGAFAFARLPAGSRVLSVRALGYARETRPLVLAPDLAPLRVELAADPILLEGLVAVGDRFEQRRAAFPYASQMIGRDVLVRSASVDMASFVRQAVGIVPTPCRSLTRQGIVQGNRATAMCIRVRGRSLVPTLWVDEVLAVGGFPMLESFDPKDIERVEVYNGGSVIRVYTVAWMEQAARRNFVPQPFR